MTQRIVLFNGPPRSGKDTAARACMESEDLNGFPRVFDRMSMPIKRAFAGMMGQHIDRWGNVDYFEDRKEAFGAGPLATSYRLWQIDFSERFMKPQYGNDVFGRLFNNRQATQHIDAAIFVPDCGFDTEYKTLTENFGPDNVLVVKIERPGTSFKGDSRNYLKVGSFGDKRDSEHVIHISNSGTEAEFTRKVITRVGRWLTGGQT